MPADSSANRVQSDSPLLAGEGPGERSGGEGLAGLYTERATIPMFEIAETLGCPPSEVEERLLHARDAGEIGYFGIGRGLLIELFPHPPDLASRLKGLLDGHERAQAQRLDEIGAYATRRACRTATIARHFGVQHPGRCGHCDACVRGAESGVRSAEPAEDAVTVAALDRAPEDIIIECIAELPFPMGRRGVGRVLHGSVASAVQADRSRHFGALASLTIKGIEREIDRLVEAGYLLRGDDEFRLLAVTAAGLAKEPGPIPAPPAPSPARRGGEGRREARNSERAPRVRAASANEEPLPAYAEGDPAIEQRFERLRAWRANEARSAGLPAYTIFHDATLRDLAGSHIGALDDLKRIKGFGPAKLERYGEALLDLLSEDAG